MKKKKSKCYKCKFYECQEDMLTGAYNYCKLTTAECFDPTGTEQKYCNRNKNIIRLFFKKKPIFNDKYEA